METGATRTSRTERRKQGVVLTDRDLKIIFTVGRFGLASSRHLSALYFNAVANTAHKRLRSLYNAGFLRAHVVLGSTEPTLYTMTPDGQKAVVPRFPAAGELHPGPTSLDVADLRHRLAIVDVRVAVILATRQNPGLKLVRFLTGGEVTAHTKPAGLSVVPDALVLIERSGVQQVFLAEVDLGNEPLGVLDAKARAYAEAFLAKRPILNQTDWRILLAAPGTARLGTIASTVSAHINGRFTLLDLAALTPQTLLTTLTSVAITPNPNAPPFLAKNANESTP